ncbi:MAG TPA: hypothetical protein VKU89_03895 [Solirubrobacteraceae bacterium]|nr:hypothetical protein [Solirubrobacteraceae bacterium]
MVRTGLTFDEAADEYLRQVEHDRGRKPSTVAGYGWIVDGQLRPAFGSMQLEAVTPAHLKAWSGGLDLAPASRRKALVILHGIFERARKTYGLPGNHLADVEKPQQERSGDIEIFSSEGSRRLCERPAMIGTQPCT